MIGFHSSQREIKVISGTSHPQVAEAIAKKLKVPLARVFISRLPNREVSVIMGESVREVDVYIVQTNFSPDGALNENLFELLQLISACKAGSAGKITAVIPCYPYARQDKKGNSREPITAKLVANMIETAGADHVITMDLHAPQIQCFFNVPLDNMRAEPLLIEAIKRIFPETSDLILVTPDAGGAKRCAAIAEKMKLPMALIHKERQAASAVSRMLLVGNVNGKHAVIVDDMADTCGTIIEAAKTLKANGACRIVACVIHPVFSGDAPKKLENSFIDTIIHTNTLPVRKNTDSLIKFIEIDISSVFAEVIRRIHRGDSISTLFE